MKRQWKVKGKAGSHLKVPEACFIQVDQPQAPARVGRGDSVLLVPLADLLEMADREGPPSHVGLGTSVAQLAHDRRHTL